MLSPGEDKYSRYVSAVLDTIIDELVPERFPEWVHDRINKGYLIGESVSVTGHIIAERIKRQQFESQ